MGCNESFNTNTEAVTRDSDPRLLRFQQLNADIPTDLGTTLDMGLIALPSIVDATPAVVGPVLNDLTGGLGTTPADADKIGQMIGGSTFWTITFTDTTSTLLEINYSQLVSLATTQSLGGAYSGTIDLSGFAPLAAYVGKTIDSVVWVTATVWHSSGPALLDYSRSSFQLEKNSANLDSSVILSAGSNGTLGPGLGLLVSSGDKLNLLVNLVSETTGIANTVTLSLTAPNPHIGELTAGYSSWTVTYSDTSTNTFNLPYTEMLSIAAAQSLSGTAGGTLDLTLAGVWIPNVGKTIASVTANTSVDYNSASIGTIDYTLSGLQLLITSTNLDTGLGLQNGDTSNIGGPIGRLITSADSYKLVYNFVAIAETAVIPIDAATIKSFASSSQLAAQSNSIPNDPIKWTGSYSITAYAGWSVTGYTVTAPAAYGPGAVEVPSVLNFILGDASGFAYENQLSNLTTAPPSSFTEFSSPVLLTSTSYFGLFYSLAPYSTPAIPAHNGPVIVTEPYEIRNRNQAAFRFVTVYPSLPDTPAVYDVKAYASQGIFKNPQTGAYDEYWTPVPMCSSDEALPSAWGETVTITAVSHLDGMPANWGGTIVTIPANIASPGGNATFGGPWNKLRFVIYPSPSAFNFTDWTLQIVASAREL